MKIKKGQSYLIRQRYRYGSDVHDDIFVVKMVEKIEDSDRKTDYGFSSQEDVYFGVQLKTRESAHFSYDEIICPIPI